MVSHETYSRVIVGRLKLLRARGSGRKTSFLLMSLISISERVWLRKPGVRTRLKHQERFAAKMESRAACSSCRKAPLTGKDVYCYNFLLWRPLRLGR